MAGARGRRSGCSSVIELLQLGGHLARRYRLDLMGILWSVSAGRTLHLAGAHAGAHLGGAGSRNPGVPLHNHHEIHLANNSFFSEAPSPVLVILSRCDLYYQLHAAMVILLRISVLPIACSEVQEGALLARPGAAAWCNHTSTSFLSTKSPSPVSPAEMGNSKASPCQNHTPVHTPKSRGQTSRAQSNCHRLPWQCAWVILSPLSAAAAFRPIIRDYPSTFSVQ